MEYTSADGYLSDDKEHDLAVSGYRDGWLRYRDGRHGAGKAHPGHGYLQAAKKYVYDTFGVGAFQYLVKPVDEQKFAEVFGWAVLLQMAWRDVLLLSVLNFVGSMIMDVGSSLLIVGTDRDTFILFDEKPDLLWKVPMITLCIFAGEAALIYFWQRYQREKRLIFYRCGL